ncbi:DUF1629 domain-containing protein [Stenotrophomonas sp. 278]|uniref:imm11 family protein n=1 Tax=Stenotrophomonas sp. 278 TaxID=2479851 RepID=UPI000F659CCF|nr:DUF1629 domain-containing protein [Stenotrophomonas sp. 278]RRU02339.1 DUF1629 domain-containing protein [Stenotrophomonas sp. 278]
MSDCSVDGDSTPNLPRKGEFFVISPEAGGPGHGVVIENADRLRPANQGLIRPSQGGFPDLPEIPVLRQTRPGLGPSDLDSSFEGYWLVSRELKAVFEMMDADGFAFVRCDYRLHDDSAGPELYLCDVVRVLDAIDDQASEVEILTEGFPSGKYYEIGMGARLAFRRDVTGSARVFRSPHNTSLVVCDRKFRDCLVQNGFGVDGCSRGVYLEDAAEYFMGTIAT